MKVKIKSFNGELPSYLTVGKEYEVVNWYGVAIKNPMIIDDLGDEIAIVVSKSSHLNGGSWEVVG